MSAEDSVPCCPKGGKLAVRQDRKKLSLAPHPGISAWAWGLSVLSISAMPETLKLLEQLSQASDLGCSSWYTLPSNSLNWQSLGCSKPHFCMF